MNIAKVEISKSHMAAIDSYCLANYHKREGVSTIFRSKTPYASYKAGVMGEVVVADYCMGSDIGEYLEKRPAGKADIFDVTLNDGRKWDVKTMLAVTPVLQPFYHCDVAETQLSHLVAGFIFCSILQTREKVIQPIAFIKGYLEKPRFLDVAIKRAEGYQASNNYQAPCACRDVELQQLDDVHGLISYGQKVLALL